MWEVFEKLCNERGITPNRVSKDTGIPQTTLANWKKRRNLLNARAAKRIADYFGVTLQYLMTGETSTVYYEEDVAQIAQEIHDNRELRGLFSAAKDVRPEALIAVRDYLLYLKERETEG